MATGSAEGVERDAVVSLLVDFGAFLLGAGIGLIGDACHVSSGLTRYLWPSVPTVWKSAFWFPLVVGGSVVLVARIGERLGLPRAARDRIDLVRGVCAVLALYALTAVLRGQPAIVSVTLCSALALAIWSAWDASARAFVLACGCALIGPLVEIGVVALGAASYAEDARQLGGVAPTLPPLYFAAGAVASGLRGALGSDKANSKASGGVSGAERGLSVEP
jgi:hypothetical protein